MKANTSIYCEVSMRAAQHWLRGTKVKTIGAIGNAKKSKSFKSNQKEDICLSCKELKCNKGICNKFKK